MLKCDRHTFNYLNAKREYRLPCILSREEVFHILSKVKTFHNYAFLSTVYACQLRLSEALDIKISDQVLGHPQEPGLDFPGIRPRPQHEGNVQNTDGNR